MLSIKEYLGILKLLNWAIMIRYHYYSLLMICVTIPKYYDPSLGVVRGPMASKKAVPSCWPLFPAKH